MEKSPQSNRLHVTIFGETNAGKSSLFNALLDSDISIVSDKKATTTDPVSKSMELIPFGPIVLTDTAGLNDNTELGEIREVKSLDLIKRTDFAIYAIDISDFDNNKHSEITKALTDNNIPYINVFTKCDLYKDNLKVYLDKYPNSFFISIKDKVLLDSLRNVISDNLDRLRSQDNPLISDVLKPFSHVVMVMPIDSEAPKNRLILPQVQVLRDLLDHDIFAHTTTVDGLSRLIEYLPHIDLVITDSKVFKEVFTILPSNIKLTSFSIIMARQKGDLQTFIKGIKAIPTLNDGDNVLICENCTHNKTHEDIGRNLIPNMLYKKTGKKLNTEFKAGLDFPKDLSKYKLIIQCGGCMATKKEMESRMLLSEKANVPITNYGVFLGFASDILDKSVEIFMN